MICQQMRAFQRPARPIAWKVSVIPLPILAGTASRPNVWNAAACPCLLDLGYLYLERVHLDRMWKNQNSVKSAIPIRRCVVSRLPRCVQLRRLLSSASFVGCADIGVESLTDHCDDVQPGDVFVAKRGFTADGHDFAKVAFERGADAIVCERPLSTVDVPQCVVPNAAVAFAQICHALHGSPAHRLPIVGVTGTDGKTTTTWLLRSILSQPSDGRPAKCVALSGSIDVDDGVMLNPSALTTPGPMALAEWLGRSVGNGASAAVLEISSHALAQDRTAGILLDAAVITGFGRDHLDFHETVDAYATAKSRIVEQTKASARIVVGANAVESVLGRVNTSQRDVVIFGDHLKARASVEVVEESLSGLKLRLQIDGEMIEVESSLIGRHNAENILAAATAAKHFGVTAKSIRSGVAAVSVVPGRMEPIDSGDRFQVFVDYAHTPRAIETVVGVARRLATGRVIAVSGAGGGRDRGKRILMGEALSSADLIVLTSDNPRHEDPLTICDQLRSGVRGEAVAETIIDRQQAVEHAIASAQAGDLVLVLGKGHEATQLIGAETRLSDDRDICREAIAGIIGPVAAS